MPEPVRVSAKTVDLSQRFFVTNTVVASPALAAETIIAQLPAIPGDTVLAAGVLLNGWAAYTVGTTGNAVRFRIRETGLAGTIVGDTGALTGSQHGAGILSADDVTAFDPTLPAGGVYVLTMQVSAATAASTVSQTVLQAIVI